MPKYVRNVEMILQLYVRRKQKDGDSFFLRSGRTDAQELPSFYWRRIEDNAGLRIPPACLITPYFNTSTRFFLFFLFANLICNLEPCGRMPLRPVKVIASFETLPPPTSWAVQCPKGEVWIRNTRSVFWHVLGLA